MSKMNELSQALDDLIACGEGLIRTANAIRDMFAGESEPEEKPAPAPEPPTAEAPAEPTAEAPAEPPAEEPKGYTFAEVRKAFSAKSHAGYTDQVKALITSFGADKLSAVKESDYPALMEALEAIV